MPANGTPIALFTDFVAETGPAILTSPTEMVNDAQLRTYLIAKMTKNRESESLQGGSKIRDILQLSTNGSTQNYLPNQQFSPINPQNATVQEIPWRFTVSNWTYTEEEANLNGEFYNMRSDARFDQYKALIRSKQMAMWTDAWNYYEQNILWAQPSSAQMENANGLAQYSIPAYLSENTTTYLPPSSTWTASTIMGIDPATNPNWRNQVESYNYNTYLDPNNGLVNALIRMHRDVMFEPLPSKKEYSENDRLDKMCIVTNKDGIQMYETALAAANDRTVAAQSIGYPQPEVYGRPLYYISSLDTAQIVPNSAGTGYQAPPSGQPRYYYLNLEYLRMIWHTKKYFDQTAPMNWVGQPFTYVVYVNSYNNLFLRSRRRQGIVYPSAT